MIGPHLAEELWHELGSQSKILKACSENTLPSQTRAHLLQSTRTRRGLVG